MAKLSLQRLRSLNFKTTKHILKSSLQVATAAATDTRALLRSLRLPTPTESPIARQVLFAEFPKPTIGRKKRLRIVQVGEWANALVSHYAAYSDNNASSSANRRRMRTLVVRELRWYRFRGGGRGGKAGAGGGGRPGASSAAELEHEYVVAVITDPQYACERLVKLERARDDRMADVDDGSEPYPGQSNYARSEVDSFSSSRSSLSICDYDSSGDLGFECLDTIRVLHELPHSDLLIERAIFQSSQGHDVNDYHGDETSRFDTHNPNSESRAPTLLDLALMSLAAHENNNHHMWAKQCAWFCTMLMRTMQSNFRHHVAHRDSTLSMQNWMVELLEGALDERQAGEISKEQDRVICDVVDAYRGIRHEVMMKIKQAEERVVMYKEKHIFIDEAVAQRDEAAALAATAVASSVEATARAAEAAARAADAEQRAEKEARLREEAEDRAYEEAQRNEIAKKELRDLRRRLEELESSARSKGRRSEYYD
ncbi:hypothetical protein H0H92_008211 [Tricholoma furcatifolium]|nr:hypothetical protein H0H92_008211 [Tricholoma furcatifolium]